MNQFQIFSNWSRVMNNRMDDGICTQIRCWCISTVNIVRCIVISIQIIRITIWCFNHIIIMGAASLLFYLGFSIIIIADHNRSNLMAITQFAQVIELFYPQKKNRQYISLLSGIWIPFQLDQLCIITKSPQATYSMIISIGLFTVQYPISDTMFGCCDTVFIISISPKNSSISWMVEFSAKTRKKKKHSQF